MRDLGHWYAPLLDVTLQRVDRCRVCGSPLGLLMDPFPHTYEAKAEGGAVGSIAVSSPGVPDLVSDTPKEFGGPGDQWSPETMLMASVADCFILSFRAVAAASQFEWTSVSCTTEGTLDRVDRVTRFTSITNTVTLGAPAGTPEDKARKILEKAEQVCLIGNSLNAVQHLAIQLHIAD